MLRDDLIDQAQFLLSRDKRRPRQANLRRAISTAYYALFHGFGYYASKYLLGGKLEDRHLRDAFRRSLQHAELREAMRGFASGNPRVVYRELLDEAVSPGVTQVARIFVQLQGKRHAADYDLAEQTTKELATLAVSDAIAELRAASQGGDKEFKVFVLAMVSDGTLRQRG